MCEVFGFAQVFEELYVGHGQKVSLYFYVCQQPIYENDLFLRETAKIITIMDIESRMARLEERLTWLQQHATEQDKVINQQSVEIEKLTRALLLLKKQIPASPDDSDSEPPHERPPHY